MIDESSALIEQSAASFNLSVRESSDSLPSLLDQCSELVRKVEQDREPVRVISHLACTGGTLISKFLASMPNTMLLSEVAPHSSLVDAESRFVPSDLIQLTRLSNRRISETLAGEIFRNGMRAIYAQCEAEGARLVLRDHAHSKYSVGSDVESAPSLLQELAPAFPVLCAVTVRHPLDSFLSLIKNDWRHFEPFTLDEYGRRYLLYLDDHDAWPVFQYEAFVGGDARATTAALCEALALPFNEEFESLFSVQGLSGDSGRSSKKIGKRTRRPIPDAVRDQLPNSPRYRELCERLGYDWRPDDEGTAG